MSTELKQAEVTDSMIREAFLANGFTIKDGHSDLKPYVYAAARAILALRPERVPMTDEEIGYWYSRTPSNFVFSHFKAAIRSAEAHHGITTTPQPSNA